MRTHSLLHRALSATVMTALIAGLPATALAAPTKHGRHPTPSQGAGRPVTHIGAGPAGTVRPTTEVVLSTGQGELINLPANVSDVWVSNPAAADVYVNNPHQIHLFGKDSGETTLFATTANGTVVYSANIRVSQNLTSIDRMLKLAMPDANIQVVSTGQIAVLTGTVASPDDSAQAQRIVTSLLNPGVDVSSATAMLKISVFNRLRMATPLQVNLQVRIAEVSRSFVKNIGVNIGTYDSSGGFKFGVGQGTPAMQYAPQGGLFTGGTTATPGSSLVGTVTNGTTLAAAGKLLGLNILSSLDLGERDGQVSTLANPNMTVISGETGSFLAGGEFPIPIAQTLGSISIEYKQYGVSLSYTPTVLSDGRISLHVRPEVSQISAENSVTLSGTSIPALTTRRAETTVELGSGQSMMIAGLLQNNHNNSITKAPGLGDVPVVGALFRSNGFQRNETELVIVITPYLVKPVNANDIVLPTDGYKAPTDLDRVLLGQLGSGTTGGDRPKPSMAPPAAAAPAFGAAAPAPAAPTGPITTIDVRPPAIMPRQPDAKPATSAAATPGFSLN